MNEYFVDPNSVKVTAGHHQNWNPFNEPKTQKTFFSKKTMQGGVQILNFFFFSLLTIISNDFSGHGLSTGNSYALLDEFLNVESAT